jgi:hypothetical protein
VRMKCDEIQPYSIIENFNLKFQIILNKQTLSPLRTQYRVNPHITMEEQFSPCGKYLVRFDGIYHHRSLTFYDSSEPGIIKCVVYRALPSVLQPFAYTLIWVPNSSLVITCMRAGKLCVFDIDKKETVFTELKEYQLSIDSLIGTNDPNYFIVRTQTNFPFSITLLYNIEEFLTQKWEYDEVYVCDDIKAKYCEVKHNGLKISPSVFQGTTFDTKEVNMTWAEYYQICRNPTLLSSEKSRYVEALNKKFF